MQEALTSLVDRFASGSAQNRVQAIEEARALLAEELRKARAALEQEKLGARVKMAPLALSQVSFQRVWGDAAEGGASLLLGAPAVPLEFCYWVHGGDEYEWRFTFDGDPASSITMDENDDALPLLEALLARLGLGNESPAEFLVQLLHIVSVCKDAPQFHKLNIDDVLMANGMYEDEDE